MAIFWLWVTGMASCNVVALPLPARGGASNGMSACCNTANIYSCIKTGVQFLPWLQVSPCERHSGGLGLCLALATCWHHCVNLWQISEAAARGVYICWAVFCWVLPREKLNHRVGFRFCFSQWKNWTLSNDMNSFPKTFSFQQWVKEERFHY